VLDSSCEQLANLNPFRYRSYYYDTETDLYFLKTRYYDPEIGRFISIDGISYLNPNAINGLNLYAYCSNNPVMAIDPNGCFPWLLLGLGLLLLTPIGGTVTQAAISTVSYVGTAAVAGVDYLINGSSGSFYQDMNAIGWNPFNTDENKVLNSTKISFYKGVPVFRTNMERSGSFGAIFLSRGYYDASGTFIKENPDTVKHERGHNWQLMMMGIANYGLFIGLPSWQEWSLYKYYDRPWEITADLLGGVSRSEHKRIDRGWNYLFTASFFGFASYLFLLGEYKLI
jgi:RHS repeat-associated protein